MVGALRTGRRPVSSWLGEPSMCIPREFVIKEVMAGVNW
jgi:hypothetical protein